VSPRGRESAGAAVRIAKNGMVPCSTRRFICRPARARSLSDRCPFHPPRTADRSRIAAEIGYPTAVRSPVPFGAEEGTQGAPRAAVAAPATV